jgi:hypothetical protein
MMNRQGGLPTTAFSRVKKADFAQNRVNECNGDFATTTD